MIKLELGKKPDKLTIEKQQELTQKFIANKKARVWNKEYIKEAVFAMSYGKCCFSECLLNQRGSYLEIEHFYPKEIYEDKVVEWGNLLPSSKTCNAKKGTLDTKETPIINPFIDDPKEHFYFKQFKYFSKTDLGTSTIDYTDLNNEKHFVDVRGDIAIEVDKAIRDLHQDVLEYKEKKTISRKSKQYIRLLKSGEKTKEFSAFMATTILTHPHNQEIINFFKDKGLWTEEMQKLIEELESIALLP
jgi:hypothetical protein